MGSADLLQTESPGVQKKQQLVKLIARAVQRTNSGAPRELGEAEAAAQSVIRVPAELASRASALQYAA